MMLFAQEVNKSFEGYGPERPERIENILKSCSDVEYVPLKEEVALWAIRKVHDTDYISYVKKMSSQGAVMQDLNFSNCWEAALNAVNASLKAAEESEGGSFAVVRPPGHHAHRAEAKGFCFFNNVAVVIKAIFPGERVAVIDIDAHYGDGTHDIFIWEENVFYSSIHADTNRFYPGIRYSSDNSLLIDAHPGEEDDGMFLKHLRELTEAVRDFKPEVVVVSAGFDTFYTDPVMGFSIKNPSTYRSAGKLIAGLCSIRVAVLEGGYHKELGLCVREFLEGFISSQRQT